MISADNTAPINAISPTVTKPVRYDRKSLLVGLMRRKQNISVFQTTIKAEQEAIKYQRYIISQIDKDHPDVKILKMNIQKRFDNIQTFRKAIKSEKEMMKTERAMAASLRQNR